MRRISRNPEITGRHQMQGYWQEFRPCICPELRTQAGTVLLPESELGLIFRTGLADNREAIEEFWQRAMGSNKLVT